MYLLSNSFTLSTTPTKLETKRNTITEQSKWKILHFGHPS